MAISAKIVYRAFELGMIVITRAAGQRAGNHPPLIMTREQIDEGVGLLDQAIVDALAW